MYACLHPTVCSRNETESTRQTAEKTELASMCTTTNDVLTSDTNNLPVIKCASAEQSSISENTVSNLDQVAARLNGDDAKSDSSDVTIHVEYSSDEETSTGRATVSHELQDDSSISSSDNDKPSKASTVICSTEENKEASSVKVPFTINSGTTKNNVTEAETPRPKEEFRVQENPTCANKTPETVKSNTKGKKLTRSLSDYSHNSSLDLGPMKRSNTVSFKVEATALTVVREVSLKIEPPEEVVVESSCLTRPNSELQEESEDKVIVNPDTERAVYRPSRKRATSGLDSVMIKSANYARRSVKVITNVEEVVKLDNATDNENLSSVPRVNTFNRYRNAFSWSRGRSFTRHSFTSKSKDNFLSFHHISYTVQQKKFFRAIGTKTILKNVRYICYNNVIFESCKSYICIYINFSGIMHTGMNAIMGPSGCGKTW